MRILHVITTLDVGGAEMHLLSQVRGQAARGHSVRVVYLKGFGKLARDFREAGAELAAPLGGLLSGLFRLRRQLAWADIVHSHLLKADVLTAGCATLLGCRARLLSGKHNDEQVLKRPWVSRAHRFFGNLPARTIVLSDHVGRFIEHHGRVRPERIRRVYYGIDPEPFERAAELAPRPSTTVREEFGFAPGDVVFTCVARFAPQKAHDILLEAFARAREQDRTLRLLLVGEDPFGDGKERAIALAERLGLIASGAVVFAGLRRDIAQLLAASDVFVMSSLWEGLGLVFLEAMASGLPVLSTRVSAVPEVVVEGETGLLVPPGEVAPLADAMVQLASDEPARRALGERGRARVRSVFGLERMVQETLAHYEDVLREAGR